MEFSSLIVSNQGKHIALVFICLVLILKIALVSSVNQEIQVRYKWSIYLSKICAILIFSVMVYIYIYRFTRCIWVRGNMMILNLLLIHIMISSDRFLEGNLIMCIGLYNLPEDAWMLCGKYWFIILWNVLTDDAAKKLPVSLWFIVTGMASQALQRSSHHLKQGNSQVKFDALDLRSVLHKN